MKKQVFLLSFTADNVKGIQAVEFMSEKEMSDADEAFDDLFEGYESVQSCLEV